MRRGGVGELNISQVVRYYEKHCYEDQHPVSKLF